MASLARRSLAFRPVLFAVLILVGVPASLHAEKVSHWPLDEGDGDIFENVVDAQFDGYLLDETIVVDWVPVVLNEDGTGPNQDFAVAFINDAQTNPTTRSFIQTDYPGIGGNNPRTITCWFKADPTPQLWNEILGYGVPSRNGVKWHFRLNGNVGNGDLGAVRTEFQGGRNVTRGRVDDGRWHHIVAVFPEGGTQGAQIDHYVDGILQEKDVADFVINTDISDPTFNVTLGMTRQNATTSLRFGTGQLADVRFYDEALDQNGILAVLEGDEPPPPTPCETMTVICDVTAETNSATATLTLEPEGCSCRSVLVTLGERELGARTVGNGGVVQLRVDELCELAAGQDVELTLTCEGTEISGSCTVSCPEPRGLVAHWPLDEGEGVNFANAADDRFDGYLLDETITVGWAPVDPNADGAGPSQEFAVELLNETFQNPITRSFIQTDYPGIPGHLPRTIAFWMQAARTGSNEFLGYGVPANSLKWHTRINNGAADGVVGAARTEYQGGRVVGTTLIDDGLWHHVAVVFPDGATTGAEIDHYVDGVLESKTVGDFAINTDISNPIFNVTLGMTRQNATTDLRFGNGLIADMRIYDTGLGEDEILELFTAGRCFASRSLDRTRYVPGDVVTVSLKVINVGDGATLAETFPAGWTVSANPDSGAIDGDSISFTLTEDAELSYELTVPDDFCEPATIDGALMDGADCSTGVRGDASLICVAGCSELDPATGGVREMLFIGPIAAGRLVNASGQCDDFDETDGSAFDTRDYLDDGQGTSEETIAASHGDEITPDFEGDAGGVGVGASPNPNINPRAEDGVLTVWYADANTEGYVNLNDADNVGALDDHITYSLVYLVNTTGAELPVTLEVSGDDAVKVRLNGQLVFVDPLCGGVAPYGAGSRVSLDGDLNPALEPGSNTLLVAIVERGGGNGIRLVVRDELDLPLVDGSVVTCLTPGTVVTPEEICDNEQDDDGDGDIDCDDDDCEDTKPCMDPTGTPYVRGDTNADGSVNLSDGVNVLNVLFLGIGGFPCEAAADTNSDGAINLSDGVNVLNVLFLGIGSIPAPSACGEEPVADPANCAAFAPCAG